PRRSNSGVPTSDDWSWTSCQWVLASGLTVPPASWQHYRASIGNLLRLRDKPAACDPDRHGDDTGVQKPNPIASNGSVMGGASNRARAAGALMCVEGETGLPRGEGKRPPRRQPG